VQRVARPQLQSTVTRQLGGAAPVDDGGRAKLTID